MSNRQFVAIEEDIDGYRHSGLSVDVPKGAFNTNLFAMITCDDKKCVVTAKTFQFTATKDAQPKTYSNFFDLYESALHK